jgi:hypothetical protein
VQIPCKFAADSASLLVSSCTGSGDLSCQEKEEILRVHNELRQDLSFGKVPKQPAARNMLEMV